MGLNIKRALIAAAAVLVSAGAWANSYTIVDLGQHVNPVGVSGAREVAGESLSIHPRGEVYRDGRWYRLPSRTDVYGMNKHGDTVGMNYEMDVPYFWPRRGDGVIMQLPNGENVGKARAINEHQYTVGYFWTNHGQDPTHCFAWTPEAGATDLGLMEGGDSCNAFAVNLAGQVTGQARSATFGERAFLWSDGVFTDLGVLSFNDNSSQGLSINRRGHVVGASHADADTPSAFLWRDKLVSLDRSNENSIATSVNDSDEIVGWVSQTDREDAIAVRFQGCRVIRLNDEVTNLGDWNLQIAAAIRNDGVIVGSGTRSFDGQEHAFMLLPQGQPDFFDEKC